MNRAILDQAGWQSKGRQLRRIVSPPFPLPLLLLAPTVTFVANDSILFLSPALIQSLPFLFYLQQPYMSSNPLKNLSISLFHFPTLFEVISMLSLIHI